MRHAGPLAPNGGPAPGPGELPGPLAGPGRPAHDTGNAHRFRAMAERDSRDPRESRYKRLNRNYTELLQELRVAQTGVQILFAFLLTLPFSARFGALGDRQRITYLVTLLAAAAAATLFIAPVSQHRLLFRLGRKGQLVAGAAHCAALGMLCVLVAITGAIFLVVDVVIGVPAATAAALAVLLLSVVFWYALPLRWRAHRVDESPEQGDNG